MDYPPSLGHHRSQSTGLDPRFRGDDQLLIRDSHVGGRPARPIQQAWRGVELKLGVDELARVPVELLQLGVEVVIRL